MDQSTPSIAPQPRPKIVLIAGLVALLAGIVLFYAGRLVPGLMWTAVAVTVLALILIVLWVRDRPVEGKKQTIPGPWYPAAIMAIVVLQVLWIRFFAP